MIVKEIHEDWDDGRMCLLLKVDGNDVFTVHDGEPEDNTLCRNFNDCFSIVDLMQEAHAAGVRGEPFTYVFESRTEDT